MEEVNEISLPEKGDFYGYLNMENIGDGVYKHVKRVCKGFKIKELGQYLDKFKVIHYS